jgi:hypothetical protein
MDKLLRNKNKIGVFLAFVLGLILAFLFVLSLQKIFVYFTGIKKEDVAEEKRSWKDFLTDPEANIEIEESGKRSLFKRDENTFGTIEPKFYAFENPSAFPKLSSKSYIIADLDSGQIIVSKEKEKVWPIASVSKLMTAIVAIENLDLNVTTTVSKQAYSTYGSQGSLYTGQKIKVGDLLYPLLFSLHRQRTLA